MSGMKDEMNPRQELNGPRAAAALIWLASALLTLLTVWGGIQGGLPARLFAAAGVIVLGFAAVRLPRDIVGGRM